MTLTRAVSATALALTALLAFPQHAQAWDWFRSPNDYVEEGNEALARGEAQAALEAYEAAASELPKSEKVQLNRGLALSQLGRSEEARQAFDRASRAPDPEVRAQAYYNLGRNFMSEADAAAKQGDPNAAQAPLRESRDALRQALRHRPGFEDAAWNLELVQRRLTEIEQQQRQQQEEDEGEPQDREDSQQDPSGDPQSEESEPSGDPSSQEQGGEPSEAEDSQGGEPEEGQDGEPEEGPDGAPEEGQPQETDGDQSQPEEARDDSSADGNLEGEPQTQDGKAPSDQRPQPEPRPAQDGSRSGRAEAGGPQPLPQHVEQVLDALQDGEETMQRHQARTRAQQSPRRVEKDW